MGTSHGPLHLPLVMGDSNPNSCRIENTQWLSDWCELTKRALWCLKFVQVQLTCPIPLQYLCAREYGIHVVECVYTYEYEHSVCVVYVCVCVCGVEVHVWPRYG